MFPMLHGPSSVLCHFRKEVSAASPKACLQSAISLQNVKSHHHRAKEKREGENMGRKHRRDELRRTASSVLSWLSGSVVCSSNPPGRPNPNLPVVFNHFLLHFSLYCSQKSTFSGANLIAIADSMSGCWVGEQGRAIPVAVSICICVYLYLFL